MRKRATPTPALIYHVGFFLNHKVYFKKVIYILSSINKATIKLKSSTFVLARFLLQLRMMMIEAIYDILITEPLHTLGLFFRFLVPKVMKILLLLNLKI